MFAIGLAVDLLYALIAGALGRWMRGKGGAARRQRQVTAGIYFALGAFAGLAGAALPPGLTELTAPLPVGTGTRDRSRRSGSA